MALINKGFKFSVFLLSLVMILSSFNIPFSTSAEEGSAVAAASVYDRTAYSEYLETNSDKEYATQKIIADLKSTVSFETGVYTYENKENSEYGLILGDEVNTVELPVTVAESAFYEFELNYFPLNTSLLDIEISVLINGDLPFTEAGYCKLPRAFVNTEIITDADGNDITPDTINNSHWMTVRLHDSAGINGNYKFYLNEGENTISITTNQVPFLLNSFSLVPQKSEAPSYAEYISNLKDKSAKNSDYLAKFQAETPIEKSSSAISVSSERTSICLEPFDYYKSKINVLDGSRWVNSQDWVSWEIDVPEDGYYNIGLKYRQNYLDGLYSSRDILIDGEVPFKELEAVHFDYTTKWNMKVLGDDSPYKIFLTKGKHTLTLKNVLGDFSNTLDVLKSCLSLMNELYLDIIEITGSAPDTNRDYYLEDLLPDISDRFNVIADKLFAEAKRLSKIMDGKGAEIAVIEDVAYQLESYADNIDSLTNNDRISSFNSNITTLSAKTETLSEQGLDLDYIAVVSDGKNMPKCNPNFFEGLFGSIKMFFASFSKTYTSNNEKQLRIWVAGGQEQLEITKTLIRENFTAKSGIPVSVELVSGSLQQAALAGNNPDVALNIEANVPVNFALRGALMDLSQFEGFDEIETEYREGSFKPYTINQEVYGIPSTEVFSMTFVRKDIFEQMSLEVPKTWSELLDLAPILQRRNMNVGMAATFAELTFQRGGKYYNDELTEVCFNQNENVEAFKLLTSFFTDYGFPLTFDFLTRFRTGEIPIGIAPYSMYNSISYSAPEIDGLWEMYPLLGTEQDDDTVNNIGVATPLTVSVMFANTKLKQQAWEFLKWWSSSTVQTAYALKLESVLGVSARYNTANMVSMKQLPWTDREYATLEKQLSNLETLPILPGTYYVDRCYNNAYRDVVDHGENPREMLNKWTIPINDELARKQKEFDKNNNRK